MRPTLDSGAAIQINLYLVRVSAMRSSAGPGGVVLVIDPTVCGTVLEGGVVEEPLPIVPIVVGTVELVAPSPCARMRPVKEMDAEVASVFLTKLRRFSGNGVMGEFVSYVRLLAENAGGSQTKFSKF
jgi:hypothetical protein